MRASSRMGLRPRFLDISSREALEALSQADAVMSTVPADAGATLAERLRESDTHVSGVLLDAVYVPVNTPLSLAWGELGGVSVSGVRMLLHQAGEQVRLMTAQNAPVKAMDLALAMVLTNS